jgi:hypothetical protein
MAGPLTDMEPWGSSMTFGKKLMICVAAMFAVVMTLAGAGGYASQRLANRLVFTLENSMVRALLTGEVRGDIVALRETQRGILLYAYANDNKRSGANHAQFAEHLRAAKAGLTTMRQLSISEKGKALIDSMAADLDRYSACIERVAALAAAGRLPAAVRSFPRRGRTHRGRA